MRPQADAHAMTWKRDCESLVVDLPGYYPEGEGDGVVVGDDMRVVDEALRILKEKLDGVPTPANPEIVDESK